ncbi:MAG: metal-dependent transcriptional regulator [bacterium]|nr:metal-dependent transcriptional regulator [bacterium]
MSKRPAPALDVIKPPDKDGAELTPTIRDYLAEIYRLSTRGNGRDSAAYEAPAPRSDDARPYVSTSALADLLNVSAPAVNRMVSKLREMGLLDHEPYRGIALTESGRREALKQLRRHRIVETFLVNVMGFGWHEVHEEADVISRALTETIEARMAAMAGNPTVCPHGEPIPAPDGTIREPADLLLTEAPEKQPLVLTRVRTREPDRLEYLAALGLMPGTPLEVIHIAPFHGPLQLRIGKEYRIIGHNLAEMVRVEPEPPDSPKDTRS